MPAAADPGGPEPSQPYEIPPPPAPSEPTVEPRHSPSSALWERALGIGAGIVVGLAVVTAFVFWGSEGTIDAPRITGVPGTLPGGQTPQAPGAPRLVRVIGGAPPTAGPVSLRFARGQEVRFRVQSDSPLQIEIPGYGIQRTVGTGTTTVAFRARRSGEFPVIVSASHIGIASLIISG